MHELTKADCAFCLMNNLLISVLFLPPTQPPSDSTTFDATALLRAHGELDVGQYVVPYVDF